MTHSQGRASPAVPEYRASLQLVLQYWCICPTLLRSLQTFQKAWGVPSPISRKQSGCAGTKSPRCQDGRQTPLHFLMVGYLLSWASSLAEGGSCEEKGQQTEAR